MRITLYSKRRCSLCDNARAILEELRTQHAFELEVLAVDDSPSLWEQFRYDVPVVFVDGERIAHHRLERDAMKKLLLSSGTSIAQEHDHDVQKSAARGEDDGKQGGTL